MSRQYTHVQGLLPSVIAMKEKGYKQGGHHYENLLNRQFVQNQVNYRWVTDITYIITPLRTYYLCVVVDLCGRSIFTVMPFFIVYLQFFDKKKKSEPIHNRDEIRISWA